MFKNQIIEICQLPEKKSKRKSEKKIKVDANIAPVLDYMLKKVNINLNDINDSFIKVWINQNLDLLNDSEKKQFKFT